MTAPTITISPLGTYTTKRGQRGSFGEAALHSAALSYDAISDPAPLVIGTPKMADPAYGWIGSLTMRGGKLIARLDRYSTEFAEKVRNGHYSMAGVSLYQPNCPNNPKPGQWYLKHISFQGSEPDTASSTDLTSYAQARNGGTAIFAGEVAPTGPARASFACPAGCTIGDGQLALLAQARAVQAIRPELTIVRAAQFARTAGVTSFGELGEIVVSEVIQVAPDFIAPNGYRIDPVKEALYHRSKAMMLDDPTLDIMTAARLASKG